MYYERKFELRIAGESPAIQFDRLPRSRRSTRRETRSSWAPSPHRTLSNLGHGSPFTIHKSRVTSHSILIETPRLESPATPTKQSPVRISNRDKIAVFSSRFPAPARNRQEPPPPEFLIANLELEFFLSDSKSAKYNFLIANKRGFFICCGGSHRGAAESLCGCRNLSCEDRSAIFAGRVKLKIGVSRMTPVKVKSLLCYGDSHFQLCKMVTSSPSVILGEN